MRAEETPPGKSRRVLLIFPVRPVVVKYTRCCAGQGFGSQVPEHGRRHLRVTVLKAGNLSGMLAKRSGGGARCGANKSP